jgi:spermidine/putrescine transport system substrate-binding protein
MIARAGQLRGLTAVAVAALLIVGCSPSGGVVTSTALRIYSWAEYLPPDVISAFEAAHPGLKVTIDTYASNEEMLAGLAAQPGHWDLVIPSDYAVEILIGQDGLEPIEIGKEIKNFANVLPAFRAPYFDPGGQPSRTGGKGGQPKFTVPFQWGTTGIAWDSSKVSFEITDWADLNRPELHGKVGVLDDARETLGSALLATGHDKNDASSGSLADAVAWLNGLGIASVNSDNPERPLLDGTVNAEIIYNGNAVLAIRDNPKIHFVLPDDGGIFFDNIAIPVGAPHRDAALAFIDYILLGETSAKVSRTYGYSTPNQAALDILADTDPGFVDDPISNPPAASLLGLRIVKNVGAAGQARFVAAWDEVNK